jgi:hypothetical protein
MVLAVLGLCLAAGWQNKRKNVARTPWPDYNRRGFMLSGANPA